LLSSLLSSSDGTHDDSSDSDGNDDGNGVKVTVEYEKVECGYSWLCVLLYFLVAALFVTVASYTTFLWFTGTVYSRLPSLLVFANKPPPPPPLPSPVGAYTRPLYTPQLSCAVLSPATTAEITFP
jgi:hypothetical protein